MSHPRTRRAPLLLVALALSSFAALQHSPPTARADDDPDTEVAKRSFARGRDLYLAGDYQKALAAFEAGKVAKPLPGFDYNIARCHDRLGHWAEALAAYERFAATASDPDDVKEANARIPALRERVRVAAKRAAADEHQKRAIVAFNNDQFMAAAEAFKKAYEVLPDALLLYNAAQAFRLAGDSARARAYYELFLKEAPDSPQRAAVKAKLAELAGGTKGGAPKPAPASKGAAKPVGAGSERLEPIVDVIKSNRAGFRACFDAWSAKNPGVGGKVNLSFFLDPDGVLNQANAETRGFDAPDVATCVVAHARTLAFPAAPNGKYTRVTYPFDFKPTN